jgi:SAM-dependent methyltransferase
VSAINPTERFSSRVESYRRYRPGYPAGIVDLLERECGLSRESVIADIAAGTGLLTEIFLAKGFGVLAIEPNEPMRSACATLITEFPQLQCLDGTAEATGLADHSVDLITVGQAMHWFDLDRTRAEFARVLKPTGWCAVIYNNRRMTGDAFHEGYEKILVDFGSDYKAVQSSHLTKKKLVTFFAPNEARHATLANSQLLTLEALEGRILSSSYMPQPGGANYLPMHQAIEELFTRNEKQGLVRMEYECDVTYGQLDRLS